MSSDATRPQRQRRPMSRGRRALFRFVTVTSGLLIAFLIGEIGLRIAGYEKTYYNPLSSFHEGGDLVGYLGKKDFEGRFNTPSFDILIRHDERGFRLQEHQRPRDGATRGIYVLGDSYTWGWGVDQGDVFTDQMSRIRGDLFVDNLGLNASGTIGQERLFQHYVVDRLQEGDVVLLAFCYNDFGDNVMGLLRGEIAEDGTVRSVGPTAQLDNPVRDAVRDWSYVGNLAAFYLNKLKAGMRQQEANRRAQIIATYEEETPEFVICRHYMSAINDACEARGARFIAAFIPGQYELGEAEHEVKLNNEVLFRASFFKCMEVAGIEALDLMPAFKAFKDANPDTRLTIIGDEHWTAAGHRVAAEAILEYLDSTDAP